MLFCFPGAPTAPQVLDPDVPGGKPAPLPSSLIRGHLGPLSSGQKKWGKRKPHLGLAWGHLWHGRYSPHFLKNETKTLRQSLCPRSYSYLTAGSGVSSVLIPEPRLYRSVTHKIFRDPQSTCWLYTLCYICNFHSSVSSGISASANTVSMSGVPSNHGFLEENQLAHPHSVWCSELWTLLPLPEPPRPPLQPPAPPPQLI